MKTLITLTILAGLASCSSLFADAKERSLHIVEQDIALNDYYETHYNNLGR